MGLACAFTTPAAYTLIRDSVPNERAAFANSLYGGGIYLGGALASLSIVLDNSLGWRGALDAIGAYGIFCALLSLFLLPPDSKYNEDDVGTTLLEKSTTVFQAWSTNAESPTILADAKEVLSIPRVQWLFLAAFFRFCSGLCIGVWSAPYFKSAFPDDSTSYAVVNAFIVGFCGVASSALGGYFADKTSQYSPDGTSGRLAVPMVGSLLAIPSWFLTVTALTFEQAMFWLGVEYLVAECWFGPSVAVLQSSVGPKRGGTAQGMFTLTGAIGNLAPSLLGLFYGQATSQGLEDKVALSNLLVVAVCGGYLISALCFYAASQITDMNSET